MVCLYNQYLTNVNYNVNDISTPNVMMIFNVFYTYTATVFSKVVLSDPILIDLEQQLKKSHLLPVIYQIIMTCLFS